MSNSELHSTSNSKELIELAQRLEQMVGMEEWKVFYMSKPQAALCAAALRARATQSVSEDDTHD